MLEILRFIFSEWYIYFGTIILICCIGESVAEIVQAIKGK